MSELEIKKEIFALSFHYDTEKHKMKMRELAYIRETNRIRHQEELERQRIKSAEIRKFKERQEDMKFARTYAQNE